MTEAICMGSEMASSLEAGSPRVSWSLGTRAVIHGVDVSLHFLQQQL